MDNQEFLTVVGNSFKKFLETGSRSNEKLKILHGAIAKDLKERLGVGYSVCSLGIGDGKEEKLDGRYIDKVVDITIKHRQKSVAGIGVKFVMQNYSQNSNNYFENMLGETANIRSAKHPYFQIFIILDKLPYYNRAKAITKWENFTDHNVSKYVALANDDANTFFHTPNKTLIYVVHIPDNENLTSLDDYLDYYKKTNFNMEISTHKYPHFGSAVILNDYETFIEKVYYTVMAI